MIRCLFCVGQLRSGVSSCKVCKSPQWKRVEGYGYITPNCHFFTFKQSGLPMLVLHRGVGLTTATLRQGRQVLSAVENSDKVFTKMKRSKNVASSDSSSSEFSVSSDLSSNLSCASLHGGDGKEKATKPSRRREKSTSATRKSHGSPLKIGKLKIKDSHQSKKDSVKKEVNEVKSADKEISNLDTGSLSCQVQQMLEQSSTAEGESYSVLRERAALYAASRMTLQSNNSSNVQSSVAYTYAQPSVTFPFLQAMQPCAWTPTFYPAPCPPSLTTCLATHPYHSSSEGCVSSQPKKDFCQSYQDSKQVEFHYGSGWQTVSVVRTNMLETNTSNSGVSQLHTHWDHESDLTAACSEGGKETGEAIPLDDYLTESYEKKLWSLPREWEFTRFGASYGKHRRKKYCDGNHSPVEFTVMTYNILSQDLLNQHPHLYNGKSSRSLEWEHRRRTLIAEIAFHNPDILNLQEVHRDHFLEYLKPRLNKLGYVGGYVKRTGDKFDGCATMWKKDKFCLLQSTPVSYCRGGLLDRDNIAVIVELQPVRPAYNRKSAEEALEDKIVVANTHLLFNPRRGDIKLAQLMILMAEIDKHAYLGPAHSNSSASSGRTSATDSLAKGHYCPVILTGDLNLEPQSELYKFIISGQMQYEGQLANQLSGQEEGWYGRSIPLDRNFFSPHYGVTDFCQHHSAVIYRMNESQTNKNLPATTQTRSSSGRALVCSSGQAVSSEKSASKETPGSPAGQPCSGLVESDPTAVDSEPVVFLPTSTGQVQHHLNLVSAYRHTIQRLDHREPEVTTHHNRAQCSVDYILYSVDSKDVSYKQDEVCLSNIKYGQLKLVARYGLMSASELNKMGGIPNTVLPSDHLFLMTKFVLQ